MPKQSSNQPRLSWPEPYQPKPITWTSRGTTCTRRHM